MDGNQHCPVLKALVLCLLCVAGCSGPDSQTPVPTSVEPVSVEPAQVTPIPLTLSYVVGQTAAYRLSSETTRSVTFEGIAADDETLGMYDSAITGRLSDLTWTQTVQEVDPNGQALLLIEISDLAYRGYLMGDSSVDYDSARSENAPTALADLIGLSYRIRIDGKGRVTEVIGQAEAVAGLDEAKTQFNIAKNLLSVSVIKARHTIKALNTAPDRVTSEGSWTSTDAFQFGRLGGKQFDKTYVCQTGQGNRSVVEISLANFKAVDKSVSSLNTPTLPFTSEDQFTGALTLDSRSGQVEKYRESLEINWVFVDAASANEAQPRTGRMTARQAFLLERKDSVQ